MNESPWMIKPGFYTYHGVGRVCITEEGVYRMTSLVDALDIGQALNTLLIYHKVAGMDYGVMEALDYCLNNPGDSYINLTDRVRKFKPILINALKRYLWEDDGFIGRVVYYWNSFYMLRQLTMIYREESCYFYGVVDPEEPLYRQRFRAKYVITDNSDVFDIRHRDDVTDIEAHLIKTLYDEASIPSERLNPVLGGLTFKLGDTPVKLWSKPDRDKFMTLAQKHLFRGMYPKPYDYYFRVINGECYELIPYTYRGIRLENTNMGGDD